MVLSLFLVHSIPINAFIASSLIYFLHQGVDLRQYSKQIESELLEVENDSIQDCIL